MNTAIKCPKCNGDTSVVANKKVFDKYIDHDNFSSKRNEVIRRRRCRTCDHRFYTHGIETLIDDEQVSYVGNASKQHIRLLPKLPPVVTNKIKIIKRSLSNWVYVRIKSWNPNTMTHEHGTVPERIICDSKRSVERIMTDISVLDGVTNIKSALHSLYDALDDKHETVNETICFRK